MYIHNIRLNKNKYFNGFYILEFLPQTKPYKYCVYGSVYIFVVDLCHIRHICHTVKMIVHKVPVIKHIILKPSLLRLIQILFCSIIIINKNSLLFKYKSVDVFTLTGTNQLISAVQLIIIPVNSQMYIHYLLTNR